MKPTPTPALASTTQQFTVVEGAGVPRGVAYLNVAAFAALGCVPDDVALIHGVRVSVARLQLWPKEGVAEVMPGAAAVIAMEAIVRQNVGAALGDLVRVQPIAAQPAVSVALMPAADANFSEAELRHIGRSLRGLAVMAGDLVRVPGLGLGVREFQVFATNPSSAVVLAAGTVMRMQARTSGIAPRNSQITYEDIGGLGPALQQVRELIELPLKHPAIFDRLGIDAPKGVLLYGPPGTGKTLIARAVASESQAHFYSISGPEIIDKFYGESEAHLRRIFAEAQKNVPSVIFIDELDAIAPKRADVWGQVEKRVVTQLLTLLDGIRARGQVIVIGATNLPEALDPALRRPGRLDREIALHAPDKAGRVEILRIHSVDMPLAPEVDLAELARLTPGFVGADLAALCREAAMAALRRAFPHAITNATLSLEELLALTVTQQDFETALKGIEPSAIREVAVEISQTGWDDIGGLTEIKQQLIEAIEWPLRFPDQYAAMAIDPVHGVLLSGPPGTGKTLIARALAGASQANFISVKGPELLSRWVGESERGVREMFARARQVAPCVLFLDEMDALAPNRGGSFDATSDRIIGQLLTELDGVERQRGVIVVGATNRPELIDQAILRSGRFDLILELPLPDREARREIFRIHTKQRRLAPTVALDVLARRTAGFSGADIEAACRRAANAALTEWLRANGNIPIVPKDAPLITMRHFERALIGLMQERQGR